MRLFLFPASVRALQCPINQNVHHKILIRRCRPAARDLQAFTITGQKAKGKPGTDLVAAVAGS
jgi:hypothetical protein